MADVPGQLASALHDSYRLERELGTGGMATVYLAHDLRHDRPVALKVLHPELAHALGPERFQREIRLAARLQHPHILSVYDSGDAVGLLWFTMPFIEGESLRDKLRRETQLPLDDALRITREVASALSYSHAHGVIHRDIKPENILLSNGMAILADFGIARALGGDGGQQLTSSGIAIGTAAYMSPEQAGAERDIDARTDIYSLGAVLYEMLAGEPPFVGPTAQAILAKRFAGEVPPLRRVRAAVPEGVERAVLKALALVKADRYATAADFVQGLTAQVGPSRRVVPKLAAGLALLLAAGAGALLWPHLHRPIGTAVATRLAVLPFENLGDSTDAYFADGMSDEVRGKLTTLHNLVVIGRASSVQYRKVRKSPTEIGRELGVAYLLTGTVRWEKHRDGTSQVHVSPELIRASDAVATWEQPFDASLTDVFQVQAAIATRVAEALNVALGATDQARLATRPTDNLQAYDDYLQGEEISDRLGAVDPVTMRRALDYYQRAVTRDSTFGLAWARLSAAHSLHYTYNEAAAAEPEQARTAADRAIALLPDQPAGYVARGLYHTLVALEFVPALRDYEQAERVSPNGASADLLNGRGLTDQFLGRWEASLEDLRRAESLDPRAVPTFIRLTRSLLWLRRYPEALRVTDSALALAPGNFALGQHKAMISLAQGDLDAARRVLTRVPAEADTSRWIAFMAQWWDTYWALDDAQQQRLLGLSPTAFDGDRVAWAIALTEVCHLRGQDTRSRAYADTARVLMEQRFPQTQDEASDHMAHALILAYLGRGEEAIREGESAVARQVHPAASFIGAENQLILVKIYLLAGRTTQAMNAIELLLRVPSYVSHGWLRIDPEFAPLTGNPRFERLLASGAP